MDTLKIFPAKPIPKDAPFLQLARGEQGQYVFEGESADNGRLTVAIDRIEGVLLQPLDVDDGFNGPTLWATRPSGGGLGARLVVPDASPAKVVGASHRDGEDFTRWVVDAQNGYKGQLRIPRHLCRVRHIEDMFHPRLVVVSDENGRPVPPEWPVIPNWIPALKARPTSNLIRDRDNKVIGVTYNFGLHGLDERMEVRYDAHDFVEVSHRDEELGEDDPLRVEVWPRTPLKNWGFFVVHVGKRSTSWSSFRWSLHTAARGSKESANSFVVKACVSQTSSDAEDGLRLVGRQGSSDDAVVARQRPRWLTFESTDDANGRACGTFDLLEEESIDMPVAAESEFGLDVGTSNSCLSYRRDSSSPVVSVDFDQTHRREGADPLLFVRFGTADRARSIRPLLPGVEGDNPEFRRGPGQDALTQVPSLVLLDPRALPGAPREVSLDKLHRALPFRDVVVPPTHYSESFAEPHKGWMVFNRLKWFPAEAEHSRLYLMHYVTSLLLLAAARHPAATTTLKVSYPLAFRKHDKENLKRALKEACARVQRFTGTDGRGGCKFTLGGEILTHDEGRCIAISHARQMPVSPDALAPLVVVCDIGGGSIDLATATFSPDDLPANRDGSLTFLSADSIYFGANLVLRYALNVARETLYNEDAGDDYIWNNFSQKVRAGGLDSILNTLPGDDRTSIEQATAFYFELVKEYAARSIAAALRNPYRYGAAQRLLFDETGARRPADAAGLEEEHFRDYSLGQPAGNDFWTKRPVPVEFVMTGNGWKLFELVAKDDLSATQQKVLRFGQSLAERIGQLVKHPVDGESELPESGAVQAFVRPTVSIKVGLKRSGGGRPVLKEALADSILSSVRRQQRETDEETAQRGERDAPNGFSEPRRARDRARSTPWFSFVGDRRVILPSRVSEFPHLIGDQTEAHGPALMLGNGATLEPAMPQELLQLARRLEMPVEPKLLVESRMEAITDDINDNGYRSKPLIASLFEKAVALKFYKSWSSS
ncbi:MAG: hypothetical protein RL199_167 [Pseudomonadota bacterium]|jgi:hypothetical protein